jgi:hypothetical protein
MEGDGRARLMRVHEKRDPLPAPPRLLVVVAVVWENETPLANAETTATDEEEELLGN